MPTPRSRTLPARHATMRRSLLPLVLLLLPLLLLPGCGPTETPTPTSGARLEYRVSLEFALPELSARDPLVDIRDRVRARVRAVSDRAGVRAQLPDRITVDCAGLPDDEIARVKQVMSRAGVLSAGIVSEDQSAARFAEVRAGAATTSDLRIVPVADVSVLDESVAGDPAELLVEVVPELESLSPQYVRRTVRPDGGDAISIRFDEELYLYFRTTPELAKKTFAVTIDDTLVHCTPWGSSAMMWREIELACVGAGADVLLAIIEHPFVVPPALVEEVRYEEVRYEEIRDEELRDDGE